MKSIRPEQPPDRGDEISPDVQEFLLWQNAVAHFYANTVRAEEPDWGKLHNLLPTLWDTGFFHDWVAQMEQAALKHDPTAVKLVTYVMQLRLTR